MACDFQQCGICDQQSLRSACTYVQPDQSLCWSLEYSMHVKLLTEHHLGFLSLKRGCTGLSESTLVKIPHCWKTGHHVIYFYPFPAIRNICLLLTCLCSLIAYIANNMDPDTTAPYHWPKFKIISQKCSSKCLLPKLHR